MTDVPTDAAGEAAGRSAPTRRRTQRFRSRQAAIVRAAVTLINTKGVRGATLAEVAARLGIGPTAVMYYFASKEELAAACFREALDLYEALISEAERGETPQDRLRLFVCGYFAVARDIAQGKRHPIAVFNDVRALNDPAIIEGYVNMWRRARALFGPRPPHGRKRQALNAITHLVISQLFWSVAWLPRYAPEDYDRVAALMADILERGLAAPGRGWEGAPIVELETQASGEDPSRETFLRAATETINEHGYRGASVDRISARLKVTKGSFYHHNEAKDDLVIACFRRTLEVMRRAQRLALETASDGWGQLCASAAALVYCQVSRRIPLLRTSALSAVPEALRGGLLRQFDRVSLNFSWMISDGVADGSVRSLDAHVGAQMVTAMINAAAELELWVGELPPKEATEVYVRGLLTGLSSALSS